MATQIQLRRDTASNWETNNSILAQGEVGIDLTNKYFKIGDGITAWNSLQIARNGEDILYDNTIVDRLSANSLQVAIDQLATEFSPSQNNNSQLNYTGDLLTGVTEYHPDGVTVKVQTSLTYTNVSINDIPNNLLTQVVKQHRDLQGVAIKTVTTTLTYTGGLLTDVTKVVS
jgi:hypothetical protein